MTPLYDIVLVAVMVVYSPFGPAQLEYQSVDYYNSWAQCYQAEKKWSRTKDKRTGYMCLKIDRE